MMRWLRRTILGLAAFGAIAFIADWCVYVVSGAPRSKYTVNHFISAPLKNNKEEIDYIGSEEVSCSLSIFPQDGLTPCWYLRRHTNQISTY